MDSLFLTFSVVDGSKGELVNECDRGKKQPVPKEILVVIYRAQSVLDADQKIKKLPRDAEL